MPDTNDRTSKKTEKMTVREAGHLGGQRERELVEEGKQRERQGSQGFGEKTTRRDRHDREAA